MTAVVPHHAYYTVGIFPALLIVAALLLLAWAVVTDPKSGPTFSSRDLDPRRARDGNVGRVVGSEWSGTAEMLDAPRPRPSHVRSEPRPDLRRVR